MKVADIMTPRAITVRPEASVAEAARLMLRDGISGLPVVDAAGAVIGIVTEGDLLRRAETGTERRRPRWVEFLLGPGKLAGEYVRSHARKVEEVMTAKVVAAAPATPVEEVVALMERHRIKRLPVLERGRLVGMISRANLLQALAVVAPAAPGPTPSDAEIRTRLLAEIDRQPWGRPPLVNALVQNGVVDLHGTITDERERRALCVAAENIPGVKEVRDHLVWVDPVSGMVIDLPDHREPARSL